MSAAAESSRASQADPEDRGQDPPEQGSIPESLANGKSSKKAQKSAESG